MELILTRVFKYITRKNTNKSNIGLNNLNVHFTITLNIKKIYFIQDLLQPQTSLEIIFR